MIKAQRYAVIGHPVAHSKSPQIHKLFAKQIGGEIEYEAIDVKKDKLEECIKVFLEHGGRGLNITLPHKQNVLVYLDQVSTRAKIAGAVNTITKADNGKLMGDNTDGVGLITDLKHNLGVKIKGSTILILGAGGAARGILSPLFEESPKEMAIANRTISKAEKIMIDFKKQGNLKVYEFEQLKEKTFDIIINATSVGIKENSAPFPNEIIRPGAVCYDLSYSLTDTPFISWAKNLGCKNTYSGLGMLIEQAAESFMLWHGVRPNTKNILSKLS
ncbi:MAG: shikimate dehydrogenase [Pseudomonadota bacterium]|nr:shikimate dehydrogenase [Pseudomonadota bacterium]